MIDGMVSAQKSNCKVVVQCYVDETGVAKNMTSVCSCER